MYCLLRHSPLMIYCYPWLKAALYQALDLDLLHPTPGEIGSWQTHKMRIQHISGGWARSHRRKSHHHLCLMTSPSSALLRFLVRRIRWSTSQSIWLIIMIWRISLNNWTKSWFTLVTSSKIKSLAWRQDPSVPVDRHHSYYIGVFLLNLRESRVGRR